MRCCGACIWFLGDRFFGADAFTKGLEIWQMVVLIVPVFAAGTLAAYVSFDLDPGSAFFNCAMYFAVTVAAATGGRACRRFRGWAAG